MAGANLVEKYKVTDAGDGSDERLQMSNYKPDWDKYDASKNQSRNLGLLTLGTSSITNKALMQDNFGMFTACIDILKTEQDDQVAKWILTLFYDMIREDSTCYGLFETALQNQVPVVASLKVILGKNKGDTYVSDKAAWILSSMIGHMPRFFDGNHVNDFLATLLSRESPCSELGVLDAITNLLKSYDFRKLVWGHTGVSETIFRVQAKSASPPYLYKCVFAIWMVSFDEEIVLKLKQYQVIKKIKDILTTSRVEKVVRMCLTLLRNLITYKERSEEIVEEGVLEAVQQLEFEKWRDGELYDEIRDVAALISSEVSELSNFDRYQRELQSGNLSWGFIHSSKFWAENVMKFEKDDFKAVKALANLFADPKASPTTLAVACHDVGEFVSMHPLGKKMVSKFGIKDRVMELMASQDSSKREVRREALLCCQKIMLNKWQDLDTA